MRGCYQITLLLGISFEDITGFVIDLLTDRLAAKRKSRSRRARRVEREEAKSNKQIIGILGWLLAGFLLGVIGTVAMPRLCIRSGLFGMLTLVASPLIAGLATHYYGSWRRQNGKRPVALGTFSAGATMVLAANLARLALGNIQR